MRKCTAALHTPIKIIFQGRNNYALDNNRDFIGFVGFRFRDFGGRQFNSSIVGRGAGHLRRSIANGSSQRLMNKT